MQAFKKISVKLAAALNQEVSAIEVPKVEEETPDPDLILLQAACAVSKRIDAGEVGLYDPSNNSDMLMLCMAKMTSN